MQTEITALGEPPATKEEDLQNYITFEKAHGKNPTFESTKMLPDELMLEIMSTCHSLTMIDSKLIGNSDLIDCDNHMFLMIIGDPLDVKMFESTNCVLEENPSEKFDNLVLAIVKQNEKQPKSMLNISKDLDFQVDMSEVGIIRRFEFSSKLQRMSVIVKHLNETGFRMHIKGSPEKIRELCKPSTIPPNFHKVLDKYAENGYRVLGLATKMLNVN